MKILLIILLLLLCLAGAAFAELPVTLFNAVNATGAGAASTTPQTYKTWTCQVTATQPVTALVVDLEGNLKGTAYSTIDSHTFSAGELTAKQAVYQVVDKPLIRVRGDIKTLTWTGTEGAVSMWCLGVR